jgi:membrane associated rhomboid family serine protease
VTTRAKLSTREELAAMKRDLKRYAMVLFGFLAVMWGLEIVDIFLGQRLDAFGVRPRSVAGLLGIVFHPLLHGGLAHLLGNTLGIVVFGWMIMLREEKHFYVVTALTWVMGGLGIWLFGATGSVHIGASGLVFGYFGYLLLAGLFERRLGSILLSLFVLFTWGGMIFGVLPGQPGISWEGHLCGFLAGGISAKLLAGKRE